MVGEESPVARRCPNCGEQGLREEARYCDRCGVALTGRGSDRGVSEEGTTGTMSEQEPQDGATMPMPQAETTSHREELAGLEIATEGEGSSAVSVPSVEAGEDEGATRRLFEEAASDDGLTRRLPEEPAADTGTTTTLIQDDDVLDDGATRAMPEEAALKPEDGATRHLPDLAHLDDGAANTVPQEEVSKVRATKVIPGLAAEDDGATRSMPDFMDADSIRPRDTHSNQSHNIEAVLDESDFSGENVIELHNRYHLSEILGKGGFGAVYLAKDIKLNRRCVVKQMLTRGRSLKEVEVSRSNFEREAKLLAELNVPGHPNIPDIYDYFSTNTGNYLVMKYIEGQNLKNVLKEQSNTLPWREAVRYAIDVCGALHYMHTHGQEPVLHRDVKPANIQLGDDGRVWLVDFGLAKADPVRGSDDHMVTQASGSFGYTPLEQWIGQAVPASDVYAVGATLHHLITGYNPMDAFEGEFHIQKVHDLHGVFLPIRHFDRKLPKELEDIVGQAVAAEPKKRPTALQLQQHLDALIAGGQETALYTFKNGKSAKTIGELVDLCESNRQEAEAYLYEGDFERWFLLINRNDLVAAARDAVAEGRDRKDGLERFLKLILPNLLRRRLNRALVHLARGSIQFALIAIVVVLLLAVAGSYLSGLFIEQSIGSTDWAFHTLDLDGENRFDEAFLIEKFDSAAGVYFDDIDVEIRAPDQFEVNAVWNDIPLNIPLTVRLENKRPHLDVNEIDGIPLFLIGDNISEGINRGIDIAFRRGPVDVSSLTVKDTVVVFEVERSGRVPFATPTPAPTPIPTAAPTPTPVKAAVVIIFNELDQDIVVEIESDTSAGSWDIGANDSEVIEIPAGTYNYLVRYKETGEIAAQGSRTWTLNQAYRLRIGILQ